MQQVPSRGHVKGQDLEAEVLAMPSTLPGVAPDTGEGYAVLLLLDGEVKYYRRSAVEVTEWRPA